MEGRLLNKNSVRANKISYKIQICFTRNTF